jgi:hypothetical protein
MEGNMRGPSSQDCEKSYARTGVVTAGMMARHGVKSSIGLVQIQGSLKPPFVAQANLSQL